MKKLLLGCLLLLPFILPTTTLASAMTPGYFVTTWDTNKPGTTPSNQIQFYVDCGVPACDVYWEDTTDSAQNGTTTVSTGTNFITFPAPSTYRVDMSNDVTRFYIVDDYHKILSVEQWGTAIWTSMASMFYLNDNMHLKATDTPNLTLVNNMSYMFAYGPTLDTSISGWDVSQVNDMSYMFSHNTSFNQPLNSWNVTNVTSLSNMFNSATSFNQPLSNWDVSNVTNMSYLFAFDPLFNQPLNAWDTSSLTDVIGIFNSATAFNQPLSNWNVSKVSNFSSLFNQATSFNQPLNSWNTASATSFSAIFLGASSFNQPLNNWNVAGVLDFGSAFQGATHFNQDLSNWDFHSTTYFYSFLDGVHLSTANEDALLQKWASSTFNSGLTTSIGFRSFSAAGELNKLLVESRDSMTINYQLTFTYLPGTHATLIGTGTQDGQTGQSTASVEIVPDAGCTFIRWSDEDPLATSIGTTRSDTFSTSTVSISALLECSAAVSSETVHHYHNIVGSYGSTSDAFWDHIQPLPNDIASTTDPKKLSELMVLLTQLLAAVSQLAALIKT